ncbi:MAG: hypothetical protein PQJ59_08630 [Spirochaetales bacterium]|nr:hypothetical protein [Spirochaetales bacterium]
MDKKQVLDTITEVNRLLEDFFFKPVISTAMERYNVNNSREIRYFLQDARAYAEDKHFMEDGVAELFSFKEQVRKKVLPWIDEALMISPFHRSRHTMADEEILYRKMMSHIFKDNVELLGSLVEKLRMTYPDGTLRHLASAETEGIYKQGLLVRA